METADDFGDVVERPLAAEQASMSAQRLAKLRAAAGGLGSAAGSGALAKLQGGMPTEEMLAAMFGDGEDWSDEDEEEAEQERAVGRKRKAKGGKQEKEAEDEEEDDGLADYLAIAAASKKRRRQQQEERALVAQSKHRPRAQDPFMLPDDDSRRKASTKILKNRGLTRNRPRDIKIPRTRRRKQYEKALVKRRSMVQEYKGQQGAGYAGELTGIKKTLTKAILIK
eukprot:g18568.t1